MHYRDCDLQRYHKRRVSVKLSGHFSLTLSLPFQHLFTTHHFVFPVSLIGCHEGYASQYSQPGSYEEAEQIDYRQTVLYI